jgi:hypothetical protein
LRQPLAGAAVRARREVPQPFVDPSPLRASLTEDAEALAPRRDRSPHAAMQYLTQGVLRAMRADDVDAVRGGVAQLLQWIKPR